MILEIEIKNWEKFNPRSDVKSSSWFRMSNDFFIDPDFYGISSETRIVWIYVLCMASKKNSGTVRLNTQMIIDALKIDTKNIENAFSELVFINCIRFSPKDVNSTRSDSIVHIKFPSATNERTDERTSQVSNETTPAFFNPGKFLDAKKILPEVEAEDTPKNLATGFFESDEKQELEEIQADDLAIKVLTALNTICFSAFRPTKTNLKFINARIKEKYTYEDFVAVIKHRNELWAQSEKMNEYLRPKTLFNSENFDGYLQTAKNADKPKIDPLDRLAELHGITQNEEVSA